MGRLQMTTYTHCSGILGWFMVVLNINSLEMAITNSEEDQPPRPALVHVCKDHPALRQQEDQLHRPVGGRYPQQTTSPLGPHSKLRTRLSLVVCQVSLDVAQELDDNFTAYKLRHSKSLRLSSQWEGVVQIPDVGWI